MNNPNILHRLKEKLKIQKIQLIIFKKINTLEHGTLIGSLTPPLKCLKRKVCTVNKNNISAPKMLNNGRSLFVQSDYLEAYPWARAGMQRLPQIYIKRHFAKKHWRAREKWTEKCGEESSWILGQLPPLTHSLIPLSLYSSTSIVIFLV